MKKIYLSALALSIGSLAFGQVKQPALKSTVTTVKQAKATTQAPNEKALGTVIWSDDFSAATGWTFDNNAITGAAFGWNIDAVDNSWFLNPIASPSGGGYAEVNNGPTANSTEEVGVVYTMTSAMPLNITTLGGDEFVNLEFYQNGARFNDDQYVEISIDGNTFIRVYDNSEKEVLSANGGDPYPNPDFVQVNLTPFLSTTPGDLWIRFGWTSAFPTNMALGAWITYGWQIDDVALRTLSDNDIELSNVTYGTEGLYYFQIPESQIAPIDFSVNAFNAGSATQTGVTFTATETGGTGFSASSPASNILSLEDSVLSAGPFTPAGIGSYAFNFAYAADQVDDLPGNNDISTESYNFQVGQNIYARDNGAATGAYNFGGVEAFEVGNLYDIFTTTDLTAINVRLAATSPVGMEIFGKVYDLTSGDFVFFGETDSYVVEAGDPGTELVLAFPSPLTLPAAAPYTTYCVVVGSFEPALAISTGGTSPAQTTFAYETSTDTWFFSTTTPWVRMNFDATVSVDENSVEGLSVTTYPNPTAGATTVEYTLQNASDVSYELVDAAGQTVLSTTLGNVTAGSNLISFDASTLANGIYHFTITTNDATVTRKIVVNK